MDKVRRWNRNSLKWKMLPYILLMCVITFAGLAAIGHSANAIQDSLIHQYGYRKSLVHDEVLYDENGEPQLTIRKENMIEWDNEAFKFAYVIVDYGQVLLGILWILVSLSLPGWLFYRRYLKKPLTILMNATDNIKNQNLDFQIVYEKKDEMGQVCSAFEQMRLSLQESNFEMWRQMEERRRLNAAFAHDLRTPLTVLQGQSEMLLKYIPDDNVPEEKVLSTVKTMQRHIIRLEEYVTVMNDLQRLEDIEIRKQEVPMQELLQQLLNSGEIICKEKVFRIQQMESRKETVTIDPAVVMQVYENLLSNAVRHASETVWVTITTSEFSITVWDDGAGFSEQDLEQATKPFYKASGEDGNSHLGMVLNICKILCEKHGGYLKLANGEQGGAVLAAFE